jgi:hypothetical protein
VKTKHVFQGNPLVFTSSLLIQPSISYCYLLVELHRDNIHINTRFFNMGKKSRNPRKAVVPNKPQSTPASAPSQACPILDPPSSSGPLLAPTLQYPSDGPSNEELDCLQTSSDSLQAKLDQLTRLALANDRAGFVSQFVPLDLVQVDAEAYLQDLTTAPEADGQWTNLASEIAALAAGKGVSKIEGDQITRAIFYFEHPLLPGCDREVTFVRAPGSTEWRADG